MNRNNKLPFDVDSIHSSSTEELEELAVAYALEAAPREELEDYVLHLAACAVCRRLADDFQSVADILPDSLDEVEASDGLKQAILSHAQSDLEINHGQAPLNLVKPTETADYSIRTGRAWPSWIAPTSVALAAVLVVAVIGLAIWNLNIRDSLNDQIARNQVTERSLDEQLRVFNDSAQVVRSIASGASVSLLVGTDSAPNARGRLVQDLLTGEVFLLVHNLPRISPNREFQTWQITGDVAVSAGTFGSGDGGDQVVLLDIGFADADAVGVSIEPLGGSQSPTGDVVLLGSLQ